MAENPVTINEELVKEWPVQNIAKFGKNLTVSEIRYYLEFQDYSNTSESRFASVYNVSGWDEREARKAFALTNIQYSYRKNRTIRTVKNCEFFPNIAVIKEQRECFSVKICQYTSKELDIGHTSVDFSTPLFENMFNANKEFHKKTTLHFFIKAHEYKCNHLNKYGKRCRWFNTIKEEVCWVQKLEGWKQKSSIFDNFK
ncbi:hypothetical protein C1646_675744 [Rhizophagus diaphanus]|nr:hypothetical protein C1646_675744 [Rhizophagus diaphanus] [Rhizophagus sp. MUCL 43196]